MIKKLAPLTYNKSFWLWDTTIWVTIIFCSTCETTRTGSLQSKKKKRRKPAKTNKKKKAGILPSNLYCIYSSDRLTISKISKQKTVLGNNLRRSKRKEAWREFRIETNQSKNDKVCFLCRKLCVFTSLLLVRLKKSLTSFVLNKHVHWLIFLHFDPVQIISLL